MVYIRGFGIACKSSHEKKNQFCNNSQCDITTCNYVHPCKYGIQCINLKKCPYDHPIEGNCTMLGKCNLLYTASKCAENLDFKYFNISVVSFGDLNIALDTNFLLSRVIDLSLVRWIDTISVYQWKEKEAYQNFANETLGGGALEFGNVQEEIMMRSLGLIQYLYRGCQKNKSNVLGKNLRNDPIVVDTYAVVKDKSNMNHYGRNGLVLASKRHVAYSLYEPMNPIAVKIMCVAMLRLNSGNGDHYNAKVIEISYLSLVKAYITTLIANENNDLVTKHMLHIGNIGCGAFNHNINTIHVLQKVALSSAIMLVTPKKEIFIEYHTFNKPTMDYLSQHAIPTFDFFVKNNFTVGEILNGLIKLQHENPNTWAKKI